MTKKDECEARKFKENLQLVEIYRERPLRRMRHIPTGDDFLLGDAFAKLLIPCKDGKSVLRIIATKTKIGYALPPKKNR